MSMSTPKTRSWLLNTIFHGSREIEDSSTRAGKVHYKPQTSHCARKQRSVKKKKKNLWGNVKRNEPAGLEII